MTMTHKVALAALAVALVSLAACRKGSEQQPKLASAQHNPGQADHREFAISLYTDAQSGLCFADFPAATLWKSKHQQVKWFSDDYDYQVDFGSNSPFGSNSISVPYNPSDPAKGSSGPLNSTASGEYDYKIVGTSCKGGGDPIIYVK